MPKDFSYQKLFFSLKRVGNDNLSSFALPVKNTGYELVPVACAEKHIDQEVVALLTEARNLNSTSFLTMFNATEERTRNWLSQTVAKEDNRILFMLQNMQKKNYYGYMGLAFGNSDGSYIEADAVVRIDKNIIHGLMKASLTRLLQWVRIDLKIASVGVRVLSDNPALKFYERCGFIKHKYQDLYDVKDASGQVVALETKQQFSGQKKSERSLCCMIYNEPLRQLQSGF
jgi:RimJ/RimL family protein N-acetyltransferase